MNRKTICLRAETKAGEYRTPLVPEDVKKLLQADLRVLVESSSFRCFADKDYREAGCEIVKFGEWINLPPSKNTWILGLKELPAEPTDLTGQHIFFGHVLKGQKGSKNLLARFQKGGGTLLDLEYLMDEKKQRLVTFGYWAGYCGASLTLLHWLSDFLKLPSPIKNLHPTTQENFQKQIQELVSKVKIKPQVLITGAKGRSGSGAAVVFQKVGIEPILWDKEETKILNKKIILQQDILVHCVCVEKPSEPFLTRHDLEQAKNLSLICDVTCDLNSANNLLPVYKKPTTWQKPVFSVKDRLEVIAIDNLPSILPKESSLYFSQKLTPLLLKMNSEVWQRCEHYFLKKIK